MAKKKGGQTRALQNDKKKARVPTAYCEHCKQDRAMQRLLVVGKGSRMTWRCVVCQTIIAPDAKVVPRDPVA